MMNQAGADESRVQDKNADNKLPAKKRLNLIPLRSIRQKENAPDNKAAGIAVGEQQPGKRAVLRNLANTQQPRGRLDLRPRTAAVLPTIGALTDGTNKSKRRAIDSKSSVALEKRANMKKIEEKPNEGIAERENLFPVPYADDLEEFSCPDLAFSIYEDLRMDEVKYLLSDEYLKPGSEGLTPAVRSRLVEWLVQTHAEFHLKTETLHGAVKIFDRFMQIGKAKGSIAQLAALASLFVASKLEETFLPTVEDFVVSADGFFKKEDIWNMEIVLLNTLRYEVFGPTSLVFLRRFSKIGMMTDKGYCFGKFLLELAFFDPVTVHWRPSFIAACAVFVAKYCIDKNPHWDDCLTFHSTYNAEAVASGSKRLAQLCLQPSRKAFKSVFNKYNSPRLLSISKYAQEQAQFDLLLQIATTSK